MTSNNSSPPPNAINAHILSTSSGQEVKVDYARDVPKISELLHKIPLYRLTKGEHYRSLGFWVQTTSDIKACEDHIHKLNETFISDNQRSDLTPHEVFIALMCVHLPKILFVYQGTTPSRDFLFTENDKLYTGILPRLNLNRNTPFAVGHATIDRLGFGFPHLYSLSGIVYIKQWIIHLRKRTSIGKHRHRQKIVNC